MKNALVKGSGWSSLVVTMLALCACSAPVGPEEVGQSSADLQIVRPPGNPSPYPVSGGWAPVPVAAPTNFAVLSTTASSATLRWTEPGTNTVTILYRQAYDVAGNAVGSPVPVASYSSLPADAVTYTDSGLGPGLQYGYQIEEQWGSAGCTYDLGGYTCAWSPTEYAYTRDAQEVPAARVQLRLRVSTASTAGAPSDHVEVALSDANSTWLDSTQPDFTVGSDITYDLMTTGLKDRSDIRYLSITTPDTDGLCINELELDVDDTPTFVQSFGSDGVQCRWVYDSGGTGGSSILVPFAGLRSNPTWQAFAPTNFAAAEPTHAPVYFVGFDGPGLLSLLDAKMGDRLRNPANGYGTNARLFAPSSATRVDDTHLHVQQYIDGIEKDGGDFFAKPSYDLAIHHDSTCPAGHDWCVEVENASGNASLDGGLLSLVDLLPGVDLIADAIIDSIASGDVQDVLDKTQSVVDDPPSTVLGPLVYCFPSGQGQAGEKALFSGFGVGSLTVCLQ